MPSLHSTESEYFTAFYESTSYNNAEWFILAKEEAPGQLNGYAFHLPPILNDREVRHILLAIDGIVKFTGKV